MGQELKRCWNQFTSQPTKTLFLEMSQLWFLVVSGWVNSEFELISIMDTITQLISIYYSGTPALTSRGFVEDDFAKVAEFFDAAVNIAVKIKAETKGS